MKEAGPPLAPRPAPPRPRPVAGAASAGAGSGGAATLMRTTTGPFSGGRNCPAGLMTNGAVPVIANSITSASGVTLLSRMAWRNDPGPESFVFVTVKTEADALVAP